MQRSVMKVIGKFPAREQIRQWLKAGYMEGEVFYDTEAGTPQGGVISPLLANIALHGMEEALGIIYAQKPSDDQPELHSKSVCLVRYADDFVVLCFSKEQAEEVKEKLKVWLAERGLTFSEEKTKISQLKEGFDFLGFNIRQYEVSNTKSGVKTLIKPNKKSVKSIKRKLKDIFQTCHGHPAKSVIMKANPVIRGWANYFRIGVSKRIFSQLDHYLFQLQMRWSRRQHPQKTWGWRRARYWSNRKQGDRWVFGDGDFMMTKFAWVPIVRHTLVRRFASPDDPELESYWIERKVAAVLRNLKGDRKKIAERQKGLCPVCGESLDNGEEVHEHHMVSRRDKGGDQPENLMLVHIYCHQAVHAGKRKQQEPIA